MVQEEIALLRLIVTLLLALSLSTLPAAAEVSSLTQIDTTLQRTFQHENLEGLAAKATLLGEPLTVTLLTGGIYIIDPQAGKTAAKALLIAMPTTYLLKVLIRRPRPFIDNLTERPPGSDAYHSFPSGHSAAAFALAHVLAENHPDYRAAFYGLAALVAWSRVQLDQHWPTDIIAGSLIGYLSARAALSGDQTGPSPGLRQPLVHFRF